VISRSKVIDYQLVERKLLLVDLANHLVLMVLHSCFPNSEVVRNQIVFMYILATCLLPLGSGLLYQSFGRFDGLSQQV